MSAAISHGGAIGAAARLYGGAAGDWLDLSTGINPNPVAVPAVPLAAWHRLPDEALFIAAAEAAMQAYGGANPPLPVAGTQAAIQLLPRLIAPGASAAILSPTYGEYRRVLSSADLAVEAVHDIEAIAAEAAMAVVVNPNNPTGRRHAQRDLVRLHDRLAASDGFLVIDEAFADTEPQESLIPLLSGLPRTIVFRSFGKFYGLAGLRLGFVFAAPPILDGLAEWLGPWSVSGPALHLAGEILRRDRASVLRDIKAREAGLMGCLTDAGLNVVGGTALFKLVERENAAALHDHLCRHHILVRKFDYAPSWLRFGLTPDASADERLADALQGFAR